MTRANQTMEAALAVTRFGLGARPGEIAAVMADPRGWLEAQIRPGGARNPEGQFFGSEARMQQLLDYNELARERRRDEGEGEGEGEADARFEALRDSRRVLTEQTGEEFLARAQLAATTPEGFAERWALFWANLFTVSATKFQSAVLLGQYEREAIRPHVFGRFEDLTLAAEQHPAMLLYLDQAQSVGPNSVMGARREAGLNENLAREIMELHTMGADGGYSQADVTELARALTGWSVPTPRNLAAAAETGGGRRRRRQARAEALAGERGRNGFVWREVMHEPGARTVMGRRYSQEGRAQGEAILRDLARHPATARRLARRIAAHFVADQPPESLVARLESAWTGSGGDLAVVARALIAAPEAWGPEAGKIKTPWEFVISTHRALGISPPRVQPLNQALESMGQPAWRAPSPEGWPDTAADWVGPDALVKRLNWAQAVADRVPGYEPVSVAEAALGPRLGEASYQAVARAGSRSESLTLFLMSPEFQRR